MISDGSAYSYGCVGGGRKRRLRHPWIEVYKAMGRHMSINFEIIVGHHPPPLPPSQMSGKPPPLLAGSALVDVAASQAAYYNESAFLVQASFGCRPGHSGSIM